MAITGYRYGKFQATGYIVYNEQDAVLIDPPSDHIEEIDELLKTRSLTLQALLCTHMHMDHVEGCATWQKKTGLPVFGAVEDIDAYEGMVARVKNYDLPPITPFEKRVLTLGAHQWGSLRADVILVGGHSPGSVCFYFPDLNTLVSGDTLFYHTVGRTDFPESQQGVMEENLRRHVLVLPPETEVYPGHGRSTTIGEEQQFFKGI